MKTKKFMAIMISIMVLSFTTTAFARIIFINYVYDYYPKYTGTTVWFDSALRDMNINPTYETKERIAHKNFLFDYSGKVEEDTRMLEWLKQGHLVREKYYPRYTGGSSSLSTALEAVRESGSYATRVKIAHANGMYDFNGEGYQETILLNLIKDGKLIAYR